MRSFDTLPGQSSLGPVRGISLALAVLSPIALLAVENSIVAVRWTMLFGVLLPLWPALRERDGTILISPLYLLAAIAIVFYSMVPYLIEVFYIADLIATKNTGAYLYPPIVAYFGSAAEAAIIAFAAVALILHLVIAAFWKHAPSAPIPVSHRALYTVRALSVLLAAGLLLVTVLSGRSGAIYAAISTFYAPVQSLALIYFVHDFRTSTSRSPLVFWAFVAVCILPLALVGQGKMPVFMSVAATVYFLSFELPSMKQILATVFAGMIVFLLFVPTSLVLREYDVSKISVATTFNRIHHVIVMKAFGRQTATGYCLMNVIDRHWDDPFQAEKQLFWLEGLVPRALWPEKPNLSLGAEYSLNYCNRLLYAEHETGHSSSITLIGQPIVKGGYPALLLHGGILMCFLGGITVLARRSNGMGRILIVALLPWWIDFDQDFALYAANLMKFALVMGACAYTYARLARAGLRTRNPV